MRAWLALLLALPASAGDAPGRRPYFRITVLDEATGRGVPLVTLTTTGGIAHVTDSNGVVAFHEPGLMGRELFFFVESHGYEFAKDGFGMAGKTLRALEGGAAELKIRRLNLAERLYRTTGGGVYRDSVLLGIETPVKEPLLNGLVVGQDSTVAAVYRGAIRWFWGDTSRPAYPLGNFAVSGAASRLPGRGGLDPARGIEFSYFTGADGFSRPMCAVEGPGPKWIDGLMVLRDASGAERLVAAYVRVKTLDEMHERGLVVYDDGKELFVPLKRFALAEPLYPHGHPVRVRAEGRDWFYFGRPFPDVRVRADWAAIQDPAAYEALGKDGPPGPRTLRDVETGRTVRPHGGSVAWNAYRRRWIAVVLEAGGSSPLGEIWYAEADTVTGPWVYARKIVTHHRMSFYNPVHHPFLDGEGGRLIYFEGTYTQTFSGNPERTPRYDYNQILYRLDLADPRLALPVPVYRLRDGSLKTRADLEGAWGEVQEVAFFAHEEPRDGLVRAGSYYLAAREREGLVRHGEGWVWPSPAVLPPSEPASHPR